MRVGRDIYVEIDLKESDDQIYNNIAKATKDYLNTKFPKAMNDIENIIKIKIYDSITSSSEYISIINGKLKIELGLVDGQNRLQNILRTWINSVGVKFIDFRISKSGFTGGIKVTAIRADYSDVLNLNDAVFTTEKGEILPWLAWLLTYGNDIVIADYQVKFGPSGRTGGGSMSLGGKWGIPPEYAGTSNDNFVVRSINSIAKEIEKDISYKIKGVF